MFVVEPITNNVNVLRNLTEGNDKELFLSVDFRGSSSHFIFLCFNLVGSTRPEIPVASWELTLKREFTPDLENDEAGSFQCVATFAQTCGLKISIRSMIDSSLHVTNFSQS